MVLRRWYIVVPGIVLSLIIAGTVFNSIPPKYTSSGIAVLVRQNNPTTTSSVNPVLGVDGTMSAATSTLVQALDTPEVKAALGLRKGVDDFTINNVGKDTAVAGLDHPFLYIMTQSSNAQKSTEIVMDVVGIARQKLGTLQNDFHVRPQNQVKLESVVDATPPIAVMTTVYAMAGAVLMLGIVVTGILACVWDIIISTRQRRQVDRSTSRDEENVDPRVRARPRRIS